MHSLIENGQVVLDKKRAFKNFKFYFIKSVLPPLSEEHSPSFAQFEEVCGYMNWHSQWGPSWEDRVVKPAHFRINKHQLQYAPIFKSKTLAQLKSNYFSDRGVMNAMFTPGRGIVGIPAKYFLSPP